MFCPYCLDSPHLEAEYWWHPQSSLNTSLASTCESSQVDGPLQYWEDGRLCLLNLQLQTAALGLNRNSSDSGGGLATLSDFVAPTRRRSSHRSCEFQGFRG